MPTTPGNECTVSSKTLYLAFDLGQRQWTLAFTIGLGRPPRLVDIPGGDTEALRREIGSAKRRFGLPDNTAVVSCYEAGRNGFWLHRWLQAHQVHNVVVDSSSIEVNRRQRRSKTDKMDARKLSKLLIRFHMGEEKVFSVVNVPSVDDEDQRHLHREIGTLTADETALVNRIRGVLAAYGVDLEPDSGFPESLKGARQWNLLPLPPGVQQRLLCDFAVLQVVQGQIRTLERQQRAEIREGTGEATQQIRKLLGLKGVGLRISSTYAKEFFTWRKLKNRRQVAGLAGLCSTPYSSGTMKHEHGISKAGNRWVRGLAVEFAWTWLHWQPQSALSLWYQQRFAHGGTRQRRVGIVALARKLLVALWKYLETGIPPQGAELVDWEAKLQRRNCTLTAS